MAVIALCRAAGLACEALAGGPALEGYELVETLAWFSIEARDPDETYAACAEVLDAIETVDTRGDDAPPRDVVLARWCELEELCTRAAAAVLLALLAAVPTGSPENGAGMTADPQKRLRLGRDAAVVVPLDTVAPAEYARRPSGS